MKFRPAICLAIALSTLAMSRPTSASTFTVVFDTIDSVELNMDSGNVNIVLQGIPAGGRTAITRSFFFGSSTSAGALSAASQCERMALAAMSKPGKYQFAIGASVDGGPGACKLILVAP